MTDPLNFTGTLFLVMFHWFWMLVSVGLGCWVGWHTAGEAPPQRAQPPEEA